MNLIRRFDIWAVESVYPWIREMWGKYFIPLRLLRRWKRHRDKEKAERKAEIRFWTDVLCQAGENAVHAGEFSRKQVDDWYEIFGKETGLCGLLPKKLALTRRDQRDLKAAISKRIGPEARQALKEKKLGSKSNSAKRIRYQFIRAFRNAA
jgi:hypothetical protein